MYKNISNYWNDLMKMFDEFLGERKKNNIEYSTAVELKEYCYDNIITCEVDGVEILELTPNPFSEEVYETMNLRNGPKRRKRIEVDSDEDELEEEELEEDVSDDYSSISSDNYTTKKSKNKVLKKRRKSKRY